jgi:putative ABC transport system permease protein
MDWRQEVRDALQHHPRTHGAAVSDDVIEELAQHAHAAYEEARANGDTPHAAHARVRQLIDGWTALGHAPKRPLDTTLAEAAPAGSSWFAGLGLDIRHAFRLLARQRGFAVVSIVMIALGIGATTAIFSVVNGVLLTPLPWPNAASLVRVSETREGGSVNLTPVFSNATYHAWLSHATTIDGIGGWSENTMTLDTGDGVDRIRMASVTPSLFPLLGVAPALGPGITPADEERDVVVLSDGFWRDRFGAAPDIVGRTMRIGEKVFTVVGVMPRGFLFPNADARFWTPMTVPQEAVPGGGHQFSLFSAVAHRKSGATPATIAAEAQAAARTLGDLGPVVPAVFGSNGLALVQAVPLTEAFVGDVRTVLTVLLAAVALLWLAAVGNVASMQMAHAVARRREVAIRAAIGAGAARLARQLAVENGVLALIGGAIGIGLASALLRVLPALLPADFPRAETIAIDARVLSFATLLALAASLVIALWPARSARRIDLRSAVSVDAGAGAGSARGALRSRRFVSGLQVAIASMLLVGGGLLGRSFYNQWRVDRGYDATNVLTARVLLPPTVATPADRTRVFGQIADRLRAEPGVTAVAVADSVPLGGRERRFASTTAEEGRPPVTVSALLRTVTPAYFQSLGLRLHAGRVFTDADTMTSEPVVVVNKTFADKYLGATPVGETLTAGVDSGRQTVTAWKVVGVLEDAMRAAPTDPVQPEIFVATGQMTRGADAASFVIARTTGDPDRLVPVLRRLVREADPRAAVEQPMTMDDRLMMSLARPRLYAVLLGGFAAFAAIVALVGLFGGLLYGVTQRTREISLRAALGATPADIVWRVVREGAAVTLVGVVVGMAASALTARVLGQYLYGITTRDPLTFGVVAVVLLAVGLVASALPARRAAAIDPLAGLRN